jgi:L-fucose mutarotase
MQVGGTEAPYLSGLQREVVAHLQTHLPAGTGVEAVERYAFYDQVSIAYAIVVTGELQPWGNFILHKGVISEAVVA